MGRNFIIDDEIATTPLPDFELLDARVASALNKFIQKTRYKKKVSFGGTESPTRGPIPSRETDLLPDLRLLLGHWRQ